MNLKTETIITMLENLPTFGEDTERLHAQILAEMDQKNDESEYDEWQGTQLALSDYLTAVKMVINDAFNHEVWVRAEVRAMSSKGGHYYFELAEKDDGDQIIASCRGTLWRHRASTVLSKFHNTTGQALQAGISILIKASANFHPQYGFSININDIDPNYTIGQLAIAYQAMLTRLYDEGLIQLNKSLPAPFDIRHVIVISPEGAAGLGDFRREADRLEWAGACQFHYHHATFQGNHAANEIRVALVQSMEQFHARFGHLPDLMVIIRGGGSVGDLAYLNDFELAALIAEQNIPVWVGIGHERDKVLIDEVAHTRFDTPSKVIAAIERQLINITQDAKLAMQRIHTSTSRLIELAKKDTQSQMTALKILANHQLGHQKDLTKHLMNQNKTQAIAKLSHAKIHTKQLLNNHKVITARLELLREHCQHLQYLIFIQHPAKTLAKGYTLIHQHGKVISKKSQLDANQDIHIEFCDGTLPAIPRQTDHADEP